MTDAIVIGAGLNGLVAAVELARAGWSTTVLERNPEVGGAVRSAEATLPGLVHDLYATNLNLFAGSPAFAELGEDLARHGFELVASDHPYSNAFPDGTALRVNQDPEVTLGELRSHDPRDAQGFSDLYDRFKAFRDHLLPLYFTPMPSPAMALGLLRAVRALGLSEVRDQIQLLLRSTRELGDRYFATPEAKALVATWGMHLDYGPDVSAGAMFPFIETFSDMENGIAIAKGGASTLPEALASLLRELGGEVRTGCEVRRVVAEGGRATGVELADGERLHADRAVIANVTPTIVFRDLLPDGSVPAEFRERVESFRYGPGTMMIHLALSGPVPWTAPGLERSAYVHLAPYVDDLARTYTEAEAGLLPTAPLLIVGQTSVVDPSRSGDERQVVWLQVRALPSEIRGDARGVIEARSWDAAAEPYADRVMEELERYAPGVRDRVLARTVLSPMDLERSNPNLVGGDSVGGSHHLAQNFLFRPVPGWSRYATPVAGLHLVGAATWPGAGTNAASGHLLAQQLIRAAKVRSIMQGAGATALGAASLATLARRRARRPARNEELGVGDRRFLRRVMGGRELDEADRRFLRDAGAARRLSLEDRRLLGRAGARSALRATRENRS